MFVLFRLPLTTERHCISRDAFVVQSKLSLKSSLIDQKWVNAHFHSFIISIEFEYSIVNFRLKLSSSFTSRIQLWFHHSGVPIKRMGWEKSSLLANISYLLLFIEIWCPVRWNCTPKTDMEESNRLLPLEQCPTNSLIANEIDYKTLLGGETDRATLRRPSKPLASSGRCKRRGLPRQLFFEQLIPDKKGETATLSYGMKLTVS